jgi:Rab GDP dissociation inhibitor
MDESSVETAGDMEHAETGILADGDYDAVILGTGLTECILSGLLSKRGLKVLHIDRNTYYGGACASLDLRQMWTRFGRDGSIPEELGSPRDYNVDLIPKFILATGNLVRILVYTEATRYLDFKLVDGSFVHTGDRPHRVPSTPMDALRSSLFSLLEKNRCRQFFGFVQSYDPEERSPGKIDPRSMTMRALYDYFGLQDTTRTLIGHAIALYTNDAYLDWPALPTMERIKVYAQSVSRYGNSPYIYPMYGLGELPQAFARISAVHGGVYMLRTDVTALLTDPTTGRVCGVRTPDGREARCRFVVGDPSYFPSCVQLAGRVIRCYCILRSPPEHIRDATSCQVIVLHRSVAMERNNDIYILVLGNAHRVAAPGRAIALVSTIMETTNAEQEIEAGIAVLGGEANILTRFLSVDDVYEPTQDGRESGVFVSRSYDATTHFESTTEDVLDLYRRITGESLSLEGKSA